MIRKALTDKCKVQSLSRCRSSRCSAVSEGRSSITSREKRRNGIKIRQVGGQFVWSINHGMELIAYTVQNGKQGENKSLAQENASSMAEHAGGESK